MVVSSTQPYSRHPRPPAVGGAGIYAVGFQKPVTLVPYVNGLLARGPRYDWVICLAGINDLLRMGRPADDVSRCLGCIGAELRACGCCF